MLSHSGSDFALVHLSIAIALSRVRSGGSSKMMVDVWLECALLYLFLLLYALSLMLCVFASSEGCVLPFLKSHASPGSFSFDLLLIL